MYRHHTLDAFTENTSSEDPDFANECTLTEFGQYIENLKSTIRQTRRKRDRQAERIFIRQLNQACIQASAFADDDAFIEDFESFLEDCMKDYSMYPKELRYTMVTGHGQAA